MSDTTARALESTFQPPLALALPGVSVRRRNEPVPGDPAAQRTPAVIVTAQKKEDWPAMRVAGRMGEVCDLSFECREKDDRAVEALAKMVASAIPTFTGLTGWLFLQIESDGDERGFDGATRLIALKFIARCLTAE